MTGWKRAGRCLEGHAAETAVPVLAELFIAVIMLIAGGFLQHCLTEAGLLCGGGGVGLTDLWLPGCLLAGMLAQTPLMVTRTRLLAELTGVLTEDDRGFLGCCTDWWLWLRLIRVRLRLAGMLLLSVLPSFLLLTAARTVLLLSVGREEAILPLMTAVHLLLAGIGTVLLPLRVTAAAAAMPLCFLKNPHEPAKAVLREAFAVSRRNAPRLVLRRAVILPAILFPPAAVTLLPRLRAAELLDTAHAERRQSAQKRSGLSVQNRTDCKI